MKVYGINGSTCTRKVLMTLAEKGHEAEFVLIDLSKGEHKKPEYTAMQPFGVVPMFEDENGRLYESRAIARYLDRTLPGPKLTPSDPRAYGLMEQFISIEHSYFTPAAMKIVNQRVFHPMWGKPTDEAVVEQGRVDLQRPLEVLERALSERPYLAGDDFTLAEINYMPYLEFMMVGRAEGIIAAFPKVDDWWQKIRARATWQKVTGRTA